MSPASVLVAGFFVLFFLGLFSPAQGQPASETSGMPITVAAYAGDTGALIYLAAELGLYEENGLDVRITDYEAGKLAADALLDGKADVCTAADFVFVKDSLSHHSLRILTTVAAAEVNFLAARADLGVDSPQDLRGREIGVTLGSAGEFFLENFLLLNDLKPQAVHMIDQTPSQIVQSVIKGQIAAGFTWQPNVFRMEQALGEKLKTWTGQSGQDMYFLLLSTSNWLQKYPQAAERLVRALQQTAEQIRENPDVVPTLLRERFHYDPGYIQTSLAANTYGLELSKALLFALEDQARWILRANQSLEQDMPNYLDMIYFQAMDVVSPKNVSIIHAVQAGTD
jgi:NitT/TauT family transport system substrate-binding protein